MKCEENSRRDEDLVAEYLRDRHGLEAVRFAKGELPEGTRSPEFQVVKAAKLAFYCEVKSVATDDWLDQQLESAPPGAIVGGCRADPCYNRLTTKIHEAAGQFEAVNAEHAHPNVLFLVNHEPSLDSRDLVAVLTGCAECEDGEVLPIFGKFSDGRIKDEKWRIDLYVWWNQKKWQDRYVYLFNERCERHRDQLRAYLAYHAGICHLKW